MAKEMPFEDKSGNEYPTAYWKVVQINIGIADKNAQVVFYGYKNEAAARAGKNPIPNAVKTYTISGPSFRQLMGKHLTGNQKNIVKLVYENVATMQDVPVDPANPEKKKSFFEGATDKVDVEDTTNG